MRKEYIYPICDLMVVEEGILIPGSIKNPSGIITETPENPGTVDPNPGVWDGPDIKNPEEGEDVGLD